MMGSTKFAWMKFSTISRMTMSEIPPPCSFMQRYTVFVISSR